MPFTVTRNTVAYTATVHQCALEFDDAGNLDYIGVIATTPGIDGPPRHAARVARTRAQAILTARGLSGAQQTALLGHLRALVEEGILDQYDAARNLPT